MDAKELKKIRQSLDLNQEEFANLLGVTRPYLNALENNKREITEDFIKRLRKIELTKCNPAVQQLSKINLANMLGEQITDQEADQLLQALKNNKALLFLLVEKLNNDTQAVKKFLLEN